MTFQLLHDHRSSPPKVQSQIWCSEGGAMNALLNVTPGGEVRSGNTDDTPGFRLLLLPSWERAALRTRQMVSSVLDAGAANEGATEKELKTALERVGDIDRAVRRLSEPVAGGRRSLRCDTSVASKASSRANEG